MRIDQFSKQAIEEIYKRQLQTLEPHVGREEWQCQVTLRRELDRHPRRPSLYIDLARSYKRVHDHEQAIAVLNEGRARCAPTLDIYRELVKSLEECNRPQEAIAAAGESAFLFPNDLSMPLIHGLLLPVLYDSPDDAECYRRRFSQHLTQFSDKLLLDTDDTKTRALKAIAQWTNFYLAYQGRNDRDLQMQYGDLVHRIVTANFPQWSCTRETTIPNNRLLRVGYVSAHFRDHSVSKTHVAWLREHNRDQFEVFGYHVGVSSDQVTDEVRRTVHFRQFPKQLEDAAAAILADKLHVLVFLDIGMAPIMTMLAALRLAPVQCATWGHPVTCGLRTVDYFLSSALMEPEDAQSHYSERLIRLPGIGFCYRKPVIPTVLLTKTRRDFNLRDDAEVYLCCQSTFKYLPDHDDIFPEIALRVRQAQFVFLTKNSFVASDFQRRLDRAFSKVALRAADHCVFLPVTYMLNYWNLNLVSDVYLDTLEWSGCNSTMEAIACKLPVVTTPGRFMRGRHSSAILTQLNMGDTVARNKKEYVDYAVRLGLDREYRETIIHRMIDGYGRVFSDGSSVEALEDFFVEAVKNAPQ